MLTPGSVRKRPAHRYRVASGRDDGHVGGPSSGRSRSAPRAALPLARPAGNAAPRLLLHFTDGSDPHCSDLPVKVVVYVADPTAVAAAIRAEGLEVSREPTPVPALGDAVVGLAEDPDGYVIELLLRPPRRDRAG